jgi:lysophospholipase L1-like esterase
MATVYCLGDSLTFGLGVRRQERWTGLAEQETGHHVVNLGCNGDTTGGMLVRLNRDVLGVAGVRQQQSTVLIMGGSNDIFYSGSAAPARANMGAMLHQTMSAGLRPVVGIPLPLDPALAPRKWAGVVDFSAAAGLLEEYSRWLQGFADAFSIQTVDFRADFLDDRGYVRAELFLDGLHPNSRGHRLMADRLAAFLKTQDGGSI